MDGSGRQETVRYGDDEEEIGFPTSRWTEPYCVPDAPLAIGPQDFDGHDQRGCRVAAMHQYPQTPIAPAIFNPASASSKSPNRPISLHLHRFEQKLYAVCSLWAHGIGTTEATSAYQLRPAVTPPSTGNTAPVIHEASSEARKRMASATSLG